MAVIYRNSGYYQIEEVTIVSKNIITCEIASGYHRWHMVGVYMPPGNQYKDLLLCHDNLDRIEKVIRGKRNPIIVGISTLDQEGKMKGIFC